MPEVISSLNEFERQLIQRAKAFQVVVRMGTVSGRKQPNNSMLTKAIGSVFHLPLPLEQTLKKLPSPNEVIMANDLFILVRKYSERQIKLTSSEFVKSKLMSMNSSFCKDSQYLFFLLHESNLRALKAGIYHKLNRELNLRLLNAWSYLITIN